MNIKSDNRRPLMGAALLFVFCLAFNILMTYGGIRSPDEEIVYRAGEGLAKTGFPALEDDLATWRGYGVARGTDGRIYSMFAPGQSILLAPMIRLGLAINQSRWYDTRQFSIPISFTVDADSLKDYLLGRQPANLEKHALRFLVSFFNSFIAALAAVVFFFIVRGMTTSVAAALATSFLLALATPLWSYSGTMFRDPLALLWALFSFYCLIRNDPCYGGGRKSGRWLFLAGLFIGLSFFSHVASILFVPLFFVYGVFFYDTRGASGRGVKSWLTAVLVFSGGFFVFTAVFCGLNYVRFGSIFETGRLVSPVTYGTTVLPWEGLAGLLVSPGKGLLWFCPIVLAGIVCWPRFHRTNRALSFILIALIFFRWGFLSCRSDWHGGFCLGPRLLLTIIPFFLIPVAVCLSGWFLSNRPGGRVWPVLAALFFLACVIQQVYFCLGEPISFYYLKKQQYLLSGVSIITDNRIYFRWQDSPLFTLLDFRRGPFLLQKAPLDNYSLLALCGLVAAILWAPVVLIARELNKSPDNRRINSFKK